MLASANQHRTTHQTSACEQCASDCSSNNSGNVPGRAMVAQRTTRPPFGGGGSEALYEPVDIDGRTDNVVEMLHRLGALDRNELSTGNTHTARRAHAQPLAQSSPHARRRSLPSSNRRHRSSDEVCAGQKHAHGKLTHSYCGVPGGQLVKLAVDLSATLHKLRARTAHHPMAPADAKNVCQRMRNFGSGWRGWRREA